MASFYDPSGQISLDVRVALRGMAWKYPCVAATTANITISTALNNGDTIDGVTLATGDHVLVKDQSTGSQNGIYIVGATPVRAYDMDQDATTDVPADEVRGAFVYVIAGTVNGGKVFHTTNTSAATLGSTTISWAEWTTGSGSEAPVEHGAMGATETFDLADGHWHRGTLSANLTETVQGFTTDLADTMYVAMVQNGTGGWTVTHDPSIVFASGVDDQPDPTAGAVTWFAYWSLDGDSTVYGAVIGGGVDLSSLSPTTFIFPGATSPAQTAEGSAVWDTDDDVLTVGDGASRKTFGYLGTSVPLVESGSGAAGTSKEVSAADHVHPAATSSSSGGSHMHVADERHLSDGASGTYTLDMAFEIGSVIAWNITTLARLTVTETQPDQAVVSPVGSSGDSITFDYAATVV